jgi:glucose/arabinose dehydrogenase
MSTRWSSHTRRAGASVLLALVGLAGCSSSDEPGTAATTGTTVAPVVEARELVADAAFPVAPLAEPDGGLLYAERLTGAVRRVGPDGALAPEPVATVAVVGRDDDQRGLLGLTRALDGTLIGAWTRPEDGRLVVGELSGDDRLLWVGPVSADLANGGHLATRPDGTLVIGVGDLLADPALADDPAVPNRKVLALDPSGPPDQQPVVLSSGWNNPFAIGVGEDGAVWLADNTEGDLPERIGRGDRPSGEARPLDPRGGPERAPAAMVVFPDGRLGVCGFVSGRMDEYRVVGRAAEPTGRILVSPCRQGAARLADGRLVTATPTALHVAPAP